MYRINELQRPVLIMPDEVLFHAPSDGNVDARQILQNIIVAEERIIAPALTDAFYEELILQKNKYVTDTNQASLLVQINNSLTAAGQPPISEVDIPVGTLVNAIEFVSNPHYKMLWNRLLWKLTAEAVDMMAIIPSWLRHTSQGQQKNNPEVIGGNGQNSASGDLKEVKFKLDTWMKSRIDPLIERMRLYICQRRVNYPNYTKRCECEDAADGVSMYRKSDWVFGAYGDDKVLPGRPTTVVVTPDPTITKQYRIQFTTTPGQVYYQNSLLSKAELVSFSQEGNSMFVGDEDGEMQGISGNRIFWNSPAPEIPLRCVLLIKRTIPSHETLKVFRLQFTTTEGQESYINNALDGAELISFTMEGSEIFIGTGEGEMEGIVGDSLKWNSQSLQGLRCIVVAEKYV